MSSVSHNIPFMMLIGIQGQHPASGGAATAGSVAVATDLFLTLVRWEKQQN